jgi:hypothetical protein
MPKMSDRVRRLVGLENLLVKARRRYRECEREFGGPDSPPAKRYRLVIERLGEELHSADKDNLEEYLGYVEGTLLGRIGERVEGTKDEMLKAARRLVEQKAQLHELRIEHQDALDRIRSLRERLGLDPFLPVEARFGLQHPPPGTDRPAREAYDLVQEYLKQ